MRGEAAETDLQQPTIIRSRCMLITRRSLGFFWPAGQTDSTRETRSFVIALEQEKKKKRKKQEKENETLDISSTWLNFDAEASFSNFALCTFERVIFYREISKDTSSIFALVRISNFKLVESD